MQLSFRKLFTDARGTDYSVIKNAGADCLCLQGTKENAGRIRTAFKSAACFAPRVPLSFPAPLSFTEADDRVSALFSNIDAGPLTVFLRVTAREWQYAAGLRTGRALHDMQSPDLSPKELQRAQKRQRGFMERIAFYVRSCPHFKGDAAAMNALSLRYDHFTLFRAVQRYGMLKPGRIFITADGTPVLLPSTSFGPGCLSEDFALLELDGAGLYPLFCAGVIDGWFSGRVPGAFWMHFALQSALYSLWRLGRRAAADPKAAARWQLEYDRVCADFAGFKHPVPKWYQEEETKAIRALVHRRGL